MQTQKDQLEILLNAANFLSLEGIIVIHDATEGNFAKKFNFIASVIDGMDIIADPQIILLWENSRCV